VLDLSDLFRAALGAGESDSSLREEVELAERYLAIEALRLGPRLEVRWDRIEPLPWSLPLPRLVLQPLLENAIVHGVSRLPQGGFVAITLVVRGDLLHMHVENPLPDSPGGGRTHHAQRSVGHRLSYAFGARARMTTRAEDGYYHCELTVPVTREASAP
jgi:two-component system, LytTR family, sensor histidine kinase AlgZ